MSIFGDQPRFSPPLQSSKKPIYVYGRNATGINIGPGSHFVPELADKRNGWKPNTKSVREPMTKGIREKDRSDYYIKGQLTGDGIVVPYSTDKIKYPSPGQYEPAMNVSYHLRNDLTRSKSTGRSSSMGTSPRMAPLASTLKKNVLFTPSVSDSFRLSYRGPGSYFHSDDNFSVTSSKTSPLRRKSFNIRVQSGNSIGRQTAQKYLSFEQQQAQTNNLTSPIKVPNNKRSTIKKAWSADEIRSPSTPSRANRTPSNSHQQYSLPQPHTPIDFQNSRYTPYHHSYEYNGLRTPKH